MTKPRQSAIYFLQFALISQYVNTALALKGIDYEYHTVPRIKDAAEQRAEMLKPLNPMKQIPVLVIDGHTLFQSLPIIEYIDETRPGAKIVPSDPVKRQKARALSEMINAGIQPLQNVPVLQNVGEQKEKWAKKWIEKGFDAFELALQSTAGKYCIGDDVTLPDLLLVPQVYHANRFEVDMTKYPTIARIEETLAQLDAFKLAHPCRQPDTPEDQRA